MKRIKTLSCGCCSDGCVCFRHTPVLELSTVCAFHKQNPHPMITGEEVYRDGEEALSRFFDNAPRMIYGGRRGVSALTTTTSGGSGG